jgi:hypothetical protein
MTNKPVVTRSILLAAMAAGACFGTGLAFAAPTACISAHHGSTNLGGINNPGPPPERMSDKRRYSHQYCRST